MQRFDYSNAGLALTKEFEGLRLEAYRDCAGVWTIGYGHTGREVEAGQRISEGAAETLLRSDLADAVAAVNRMIQVAIVQYQFDALVDFCYNAGRGNLERSSLLTKVNLLDFDGAAREFGLWVNVDGKTVPGLVRRRAAEMALFRRTLSPQ